MSRLQTKKSKWKKQSRLNVDGDLRFYRTANKHLNCGNGPAVNGDTTICFFLEKNVDTISPEAIISKWNTSSLGVEYLIKIADVSGRMAFRFFVGGLEVMNTNTDFSKTLPVKEKHHLAFTTSAGNSHKCYFNGIFIGETTTTVTYNDLGNDLLIGNQTGILDGADINLSHVQFFNTQLLADEIKYIVDNGGIIPQSTHSLITAHWPLQKVYNDGTKNVTVDTVEQYNYAKPFVILPNSTMEINGATNAGSGIYTATATDETFRIYDNERVTCTKIEVSITINTAFSNSADVTFTEQTYIGLGTLHTFDGTIVGTEQRVTIPISLNTQLGRWTLSTATTTVGQLTVHFIRFTNDLSNNHVQLINYTDTDMSLSVKEFYNKQTIRHTGYSNTFTTADYSLAATYEYYSYDKGSAVFSNSTDWSIVVTCKYQTNFGANFGVDGARNSMFTTGRLALGNCMISYWEDAINDNRVIFDTGVIGYIFDFSGLPIFSLTLNPIIFIISNDSTAQQLTITLADGESGQKQSNTFDTSADAAWSSNNDIRVFSYKGEPVVTDVIVADSIITSAMYDDIIKYNFDNITNKFIYWKFNKTSNTLTVKDLSGNDNHGLLYIDDVSKTLVTTAHNTPIVELNSLMPLTEKALQLDDTLNQYVQSLDTFSIPYAANGHYTIQIVFKSTNNPWRSGADDDFLIAFYNSTAQISFYIELRSDTSNTNISIAYDDDIVGQKTTQLLTTLTSLLPTQLYILTILVDNSSTGFNGRFGFNNASQSTQIYLNGHFIENVNRSSSTSKLRWDAFAANTTVFGHNPFRSTSKPGFNGALVSMLVWDVALSDKQILEMSNNTLLKNPSILLQQNLQFNLDFQDPVDNAGVVEFVDKINGHKFRERGFGNLTTVKNNLVDINSLR